MVWPATVSLPYGAVCAKDAVSKVRNRLAAVFIGVSVRFWGWLQLVEQNPAGESITVTPILPSDASVLYTSPTLCGADTAAISGDFWFGLASETRYYPVDTLAGGSAAAQYKNEAAHRVSKLRSRLAGATNAVSTL